MITPFEVFASHLDYNTLGSILQGGGSINFSEILKKEYTLVSVLGTKQGSELIRYRNNKLGRDMVVRKLKSAANIEVYRRLSDISNQNLVQIFDVVTQQDITYILEEYIQGISLSQLVPMKQQGVQQVIVQLAKALYVLHSLGIVHRDVKEDNVILTENGIVKLTDFDISKIYTQGKSRDTVLLGTAAYAPPEQFGLAQTDSRSDIYALGILANKLVTGEHPSVKLYTKGRLGRFIVKATNISPDKRFGSAGEVLSHFG